MSDNKSTKASFILTWHRPTCDSFKELTKAQGSLKQMSECSGIRVNEKTHESSEFRLSRRVRMIRGSVVNYVTEELFDTQRP